MNKILIFGLLAMLIVVAGCAQKAAEQAVDESQAESVTVPTTSVGPGTTGDSVKLDASAAEADSLDADLSSEDVDKQLAEINPEEVKDINF
ncbi:MAG: hypothetical protein AABY09_05930 [Nanoarchaeota archaeon]